MRWTTYFDDATAGAGLPLAAATPRRRSLLAACSARNALILALWSVPVSIAVAETFLALAILLRAWSLIRRPTPLLAPRCFRAWALWAGLEVLVWILSPQLRLGWSEIRHLILLGGLFFVVPALERADDVRNAWQGIFLSATLSSLFLIGDFFYGVSLYHRQIAAGGDVGLYLRSGGLLNHWMVYGTVEIVVVAGLLAFLSAFPRQWRRWWPVVAVNAAAIVVSLTRMLWAASFLLVAVELIRRRSRWVLLLPILPLAVYLLAPSAVRLRVQESSSLNYYSNLERLQMLRVGWKMVRSHPLTGIGPGRVDRLYTTYLEPRDPVPAWHGHLHNNLAEMAAEFGIPVTLAAMLFVAFAFRDLWSAGREVAGEAEEFAVRSGLYALAGFLFSGLFEYTYGHSLGLIALAFSVIAPLSVVASGKRSRHLSSC